MQCTTDSNSQQTELPMCTQCCDSNWQLQPGASLWVAPKRRKYGCHTVLHITAMSITLYCLYVHHTVLHITAMSITLYCLYVHHTVLHITAMSCMLYCLVEYQSCTPHHSLST
jgi:hypothetical protein